MPSPATILRRVIRPAVVAVAVAGVLALSPVRARAWNKDGHANIAIAAASKLPPDVPAFFREAIRELGGLASEPDYWKSLRGSELQRTESPEHFLDMEYLGSHPVPDSRQDATKLYHSLPETKDPRFKPESVGYLPWAILEGRQKLRLAFAEYRRDPENAAVRMKCIVYAGLLAHYTGDAVQPLHTTRDYDGRQPAKPGDPKPFAGIHAKVDGFPDRNNFTFRQMAEGVAPRKVDDVRKTVIDAILASHAGVDAVYEFEKAGRLDRPDAATVDFVRKRTQAGAQLTLDMWLSAWRESATPAAR